MSRKLNRGELQLAEEARDRGEALPDGVAEQLAASMDVPRALRLAFLGAITAEDPKGKCNIGDIVAAREIHRGSCDLADDHTTRALGRIAVADPARMAKILRLAQSELRQTYESTYFYAILDLWKKEGRWPTKIDARTEASARQKSAGLPPRDPAESTPWRRIERRFGVDWLPDDKRGRAKRGDS